MNEIELLRSLYKKSCKMVDGRLKGGFIDMENPVNKAINTAISALEEQQADRWISVTSGRLPDTNKSVQVTFREYMEYSKKYRYGVCKAVYISEHSIKTDDMWSYCDNDELSVYDETEDEYYVASGWYEVIEHWDEYTNVYINCEVTAWKPLDKPWREENNV